MNKNLEILIEKLITDENIAKEFVKQETIDDMYEFCLSIVGGYTAEEFDEFACEMLELASGSSVKGNLDEALGNVAGGKMMPGSKVAAMALAALTAVSGTGMVMASAAGVSKPRTPASQSRSASKSKGTWQKVKNFCSKNKKWLIGGGIAAGVLAGAGITAGVLIHKHNKAKNVVPNQSKVPQNVKGATTDSTGKDTSTNKASSNPTNTAPGSVKPAAGGGDASVKKPPISTHSKSQTTVKAKDTKSQSQVDSSTKTPAASSAVADDLISFDSVVHTPNPDTEKRHIYQVQDQLDAQMKEQQNIIDIAGKSNDKESVNAAKRKLKVLQDEKNFQIRREEASRAADRSELMGVPEAKKTNESSSVKNKVKNIVNQGVKFVSEGAKKVKTKFTKNTKNYKGNQYNRLSSGQNQETPPDSK